MQDEPYLEAPAASSRGSERQYGVLNRVREIAREGGYAIAVHGSEARDLDLIAVPWTDEAVGNRELIDALVERGPFVLGPFSGKPHGRIGYVLHGVAGFDYIDLSVVPRRAPEGWEDELNAAWAIANSRAAENERLRLDRLSPDEADALLNLVRNQGPAMDVDSATLVAKLRRLSGETR